MTTGTITNQTFGSQTGQLIALQEGPIKKIPGDIVGSILYFANESESTRLVSQVWNALTFAVVKYKNQELQNTITRIIEKFNPDIQAPCIAELAQLQEAHQFKSNFVISFPEVRQLFLTNKGLLVGILRKLPVEEVDQLQIAIKKELPDSLKDIFEIANLYLMLVDNIALDTFFTLLQSCEPLSMDTRGTAVYHAVCLNNSEFVKLLLANGPISYGDRGIAVIRAVSENNLEIVKFLLNNGSILERHRGIAVQAAINNDNFELVKLLLDDGPIPHDDRRWEILKATLNMDLELVAALTDKWIIADIGIGAAWLGSVVWLGYKTYGMHFEIKEMEARISKLQSEIAQLNARLVKAGLVPRSF